MTSLSIIVTTYQRRTVIGAAVRSALDFLGEVDGEVIVVDDASTDGTPQALATDFANELARHRIKLVIHPHNQGVTGAKNTGFAAASKDWVLFLDSDDLLFPDVAPQVFDELETNGKTALIFFRCIDPNGHSIGEPFTSPQHLDLRRYIQHTSYGEALIALNRKIIHPPPFDTDLRGYEGLGCCRIIAEHGPAILSTTVIRQYNTTGADRLSSRLGVLRRARLIAKGHFRLAKLFWRNMPCQTALFLLAKGGFYLGLGLWFSVMGPKRD